MKAWAEAEFGRIGSCRDCIANTRANYATRHRVQITLKGDSLSEPVTFTPIPVSLLERRRLADAGEPIPVPKAPWTGDLPDEALPVCDNCPKPELDETNGEVAWLYSVIGNQQQVNGMSGHKMGLRFEALAAAVAHYTGSGEITNPDIVMRRIHIIDSIAVRIHNEAVDARSQRHTKSNPEGRIGQQSPDGV